MTVLKLNTPVETIELATDINIERAAELVVEWVHKHDIHYDVDAVYTDDIGNDHEFDFEAEAFK